MDKVSSFEKCFWAKKSNREEINKWLSLKLHLTDTMNISGLLWEHWLSESQRNQIAQSLNNPSAEEAKKLVRFLGGIHDIGKATPLFQTASFGYSKTPDLDQVLIENMEREGFVGISKLKLTQNKPRHSVAGDWILESYGVREDIRLIVGAHHGKPSDFREDYLSIRNAYSSNLFQEQSASNPVHQQWDKAQKEVFDWAMATCGYSSVDELPAIRQAGQVLLSALLIMADWIASNESYFPLIPLSEDHSGINQEQRLIRGWTSWPKTQLWQANEHVDIHQRYEQRFGFAPRKIQEALSSVLDQVENPGIVVLEAPMGVGKTEAALIATEQMAAKTGKSGLFFGLPTQATSNGIFLRIKDWIENISYDEGESLSLQLVHGKAAMNQIFAELARNIDVDGEDGGVIANGWFTGSKVSMLDDFVVGTVDHFLLAALKKKHLALRHLGLSKKVVIIDEVHAYDAYMNQYLERSLSWMGAYGVPVVLLSATLPAITRTKLVNAYITGTGQRKDKVNAPKDWDKSEGYPLITCFHDDEIQQISVETLGEERQIQVISLKDQEIVTILEEQLSFGGVAGIIVNTVKRAQRLAKELREHFGNDGVELLHSSYILEHRLEKEQRLQETIGKNGNRPKKKIIIGTQVIEQSLDIDFDLLISDLAPMDLLLQRVGRLHRHKLENRPKGLESPRLYVLGISEEWEFEKGSSYVYGDFRLIRTQHFLPKQLWIPKDIAPLVHRVYEEKDWALDGDWAIKYDKAKEQMEELIDKKKKKASNFLLEKCKKTGSLMGWLRQTKPGESETKALAQVRDSVDGIEVIVVKMQGDGYGFFDEAKDISQQIEDKNIGRRLACQTLKLPSIFSATSNIDKTIDEMEKFNTKKLALWQQQTWLKGSLGILLDEHNEYYLNGWKLKYSKEFGLEYEKEVDNESI